MELDRSGASFVTRTLDQLGVFMGRRQEINSEAALRKKANRSRWRVRATKEGSLGGLRRLRPSPFVRDLVTTAATSVATGVAVVLVARLIVDSLGPSEFGAFAIARQVVALVTPFSTVAMGVTLARYVAVVSDDARSRARYLLAAVVLCWCALVVLSVGGVVFSRPFASWLFHEPGRAPLLRAVIIWIGGYSLFDVLYGYYRGCGRINSANAWRLVLVGIAPVLVAARVAPHAGLDRVVLLIAAAYYLTLVPLSSVALAARAGLGRVAREGYIRRLARFGLPRVPGGVALAGILGVGLLIAARFGSSRDSGYLAAGQAVFALAEAAIAPFSLLVLPKVARLHAVGDRSFLRARIGDAVSFVVHVGLFGTIQALVWADKIILTWLGEPYRSSVTPMRILLTGLVPFLAYVVLRSVIDGIDDRPVNTYNLFLSLALTVSCSLVLAALRLGVAGIAAGTALGMLALGYRTLVYLHHRAWIDGVPPRVFESLLLNAVCFAIAVLMRLALSSVPRGLQLGIAAVATAAMFAAYVAMLHRLRVGWVWEAKIRIFAAGGVA